MEEIPASDMWQLEARYSGGYWLCAFAGSEAKLRESLCETGVEYANGEGVTKDPTEAVKWYRRAAEQGYAFAQCSPGATAAVKCCVRKVGGATMGCGLDWKCVSCGLIWSRRVVAETHPEWSGTAGLAERSAASLAEPRVTGNSRYHVLPHRENPPGRPEAGRNPLFPQGSPLPG
jgi:hypothetical protein